jgi:hypothetical protein
MAEALSGVNGAAYFLLRCIIFKGLARFLDPGV